MLGNILLTVLSLVFIYCGGVLIVASHHVRVYKEKIDAPWKQATESWDWELTDRYEKLASEWVENWLADCLNPLRWRSGWRAPHLPVYGSLKLVEKPTKERVNER